MATLKEKEKATRNREEIKFKKKKAGWVMRSK